MKEQILVGIDPDCDKSGFAVWNRDHKKFIWMDCYDLPDLFHELLEILDCKLPVRVRLEAGWLKPGTWHKGGAGAAKRVGANHEIGRQIEKFCKKRDINVELVEPQGYSGYNHDKFCRVTGWAKANKTNPETRVAGMLVYGF